MNSALQACNVITSYFYSRFTCVSDYTDLLESIDFIRRTVCHVSFLARGFRGAVFEF